jgi:DNA-binding NtrC family response regulator
MRRSFHYADLPIQITRLAPVAESGGSNHNDHWESKDIMTTDAAGPSVLVVDDQRVILRVFASALESAGYRVQVADNADAALQSTRAARPDAILIDLTMPYVNGMGLIYRLRDIAPEIPMAMITGMPHVPGETLDELQMLGIELHHKPLTSAQIRAIVDELVQAS